MRIKKPEHYSISKANDYISDICIFILKQSGLYTFEGNPQTHRGKTIEYVAELIFTGQYSLYDLKRMAKEYWGQLELDTDHKDYQKECASLEEFISNVRKLYFKVDDQYLTSQKKIVCPFPQVSLPFIGYIDFEFKNSIRDLKTTRVIPSKVPKSIQRQLSLYSFATGKKAWVDFVSPKKTVSYLIEDVENTIDEIVEIGKCLDNFYDLSDDPRDLAKIFYPNFDDWRWDEELKNKSKLLWSIK